MSKIDVRRRGSYSVTGVVILSRWLSDHFTPACSVKCHSVELAI